MKNSNYYDVIRYPIFTEKTNLLCDEYNKYFFVVSSKATNSELKVAFTNIFNLDKKVIKKINISNVKGKKKRFKGVIGKRSGFRKACFSLEKGKTIDLTFGGN